MQVSVIVAVRIRKTLATFSSACGRFRVGVWLRCRHRHQRAQVAHAGVQRRAEFNQLRSIQPRIRTAVIYKSSHLTFEDRVRLPIFFNAFSADVLSDAAKEPQAYKVLRLLTSLSRPRVMNINPV